MKKNKKFEIVHLNLIISLVVIAYLVLIVGKEPPQRDMFLGISVPDERVSKVLFMTLPILTIYIVYLILIMKKVEKFFTISYVINIVTLFIFWDILFVVADNMGFFLLLGFIGLYILPISFIVYFIKGLKKDISLNKKNKKHLKVKSSKKRQ